jgi:hypothetical protein
VASGLTGLEAAVAGPYGRATAEFFGWTEPFPEPTEERRERHARAEALTDELAAPAFEVLDADERAELVELCAGVKAAVKAASA